MIIKDHKDSINRELSLVEQKKMQWAKEREEMAKLEQYSSKLASKYERNTIRTQLITNTEIVHQNNNNFHQKNYGMRRLRSPSLPPIERYDKTVTRQGSNNSDQSSGYLSGGGGCSSLPPNGASTLDTQSHFDYNFGQTHFGGLNNSNLQQHKGHDTNKHSLTSSLNEYPSSNNERDVDYDRAQKPIGTPSSESSVTSQDIFSVSSYANSSTIDSSINYQKSRESGRAKWGSYLFDSFSKNDGRGSRNTTGPVWLEKSLSEARDSEEETMSISVHSVSSFLRGQNVKIDPFILAEREEKRRKAMELQEAIRMQLEERENLKKIERERKWQQDKMEEERFARQVDIEKQRLEREQKIQNEKLENQRKKEESMKQALEKAALEAQRERERKRKEKAFALQSSLDETISIQKIGERTEIFIEGCQKPLTEVTKDEGKNTESAIESRIVNEQQQQLLTPQKIKSTPKNVAPLGCNEDFDGEEEEEEQEETKVEDDGETILIGTPIKLKKKNLENFRRKFSKRHQNADEPKTSDEELSSPKTIKSVDGSGNEDNFTKPAATAKAISDLEGIAIVLQTMPMMPTFVPLTNDMFGFNQLNNLAFLMATQNRLNSPNVMLPIISRDISTPSTAEKLDLSQFIVPPSNPSTITFQIQQVDSNSSNNSNPPEPHRSETETMMESSYKNNVMPSSFGTQQVAHEAFKAPPSSFPTTPPVKDTNDADKTTALTPFIPHDGTFTKEDCSLPCKQQTDAYTLTQGEERYAVMEDEFKILTPQKYRTTPKLDNVHARTVSTQTESFMFCEYCSFKHHSQHHHRCSHSTMDESTTASMSNTTPTQQQQQQQPQQENPTRPKERKQQLHQHEDRPKWGVRNPPIKYLKASERDPFYGKSRKKRYLKKAASESDRNDDSCGFKECPLLRSPLLPRRCNKQQQQQQIREDLCSNLLPIKTDKFGRICLVDEQNFIMNEALKRVQVRSEYTSDTESSIIDMKQKKSFFLPRTNDFQNIFVD